MTSKYLLMASSCLLAILVEIVVAASGRAEGEFFLELFFCCVFQISSVWAIPVCKFVLLLFRFFPMEIFSFQIAMFHKYGNYLLDLGRNTPKRLIWPWWVVKYRSWNSINYMLITKQPDGATLEAGVCHGSFVFQAISYALALQHSV